MSDDLPQFEGLAELRGYTEQPTTMQSLNEMLATLESYRAERGPFLREIRCGAKVVDYLREKLPTAEAPPWPSVMAASVPIIDDSAVPPGPAGARADAAAPDRGATRDATRRTQPGHAGGGRVRGTRPHGSPRRGHGGTGGAKR